MTLTTEQQRIVEENMGLVRAVLSRCVNSPGSAGIYSYEDLFQIGCMGLCEAAIQYRPGRAAFSTYAYAAIRNRIYNALTYATYRREKEKLSDFPIEPAATVSMDDSESHEMHSALLEARERLTGVARKGVDAMIYEMAFHPPNDAELLPVWRDKVRGNSPDRRAHTGCVSLA